MGMLFNLVFDSAGDIIGGDIGPGGPYAVASSPGGDGSAWLYVANEVSGTTSAWRLTAVNEPATVLLFGAGLAALSTHRRRRWGDARC